MSKENAQSLREKVLEAMAEAMAKAARQRVYERLEHRDPPSIDECVQLIRSLGSESDRAVPIILFGYLDHLLITMLREELNPSVPGGPSSLLDGVAPLATASARINLAQAVYWINDQVADHLRLLKSIRNEFAHNPFTTFLDDRVRGWMSSATIYMKAINEAREDPDAVVIEDGQEWVHVNTVDGLRDGRLLRTPRLDFVMATTLMLHITVVQLHMAPTAWRLGVHPTEIMANKGEWPADIREFSEALGEFIDAAFWQEAVVQGWLSRKPSE